MSEKWQLNLMTLALAIGIILTWITWDPQVVICCMVLSVIRLGALFYEYPELQVWNVESQSDSYMSYAQRSTPTAQGRNGEDE